MLKEHKELLDLIDQAEEKALALYNKGARPLEDTVRTLRRVQERLGARIRALEQHAKSTKATAPQAAVKPSQPEGTQQGTPPPASDQAPAGIGKSK